MASTRNELITEALTILEVADAVQGPSSDMIAQGVRTLNLVLKSLTNVGVFIHAIDDQTTTANSAYFATASGTKYVDRLCLVINGEEVELDKLSREDRDDIANKTATGQPLHFWPDTTQTPPRIYLYPVPTATYNVTYRRQAYLDDPTTANAAIDIPQGGELMVVYLLAAFLAPAYGKNRSEFYQIAEIEKSKFLSGQSESWGTTITGKTQRGIV